MLIGIDLDNTIINYEQAFQEGLKSLNFNSENSKMTKEEVRNYLRNKENGEYYWQKLQGIVYGKLISKHAKFFDGFLRFLWRASKNGKKIKIISHKTEFGHYDEDKVPLRNSAISFLKENGIFDEKFIDEIIFKSTLQEKIEEIAKHKFDIFIDDLNEIISRTTTFIPNSILFSDGWNDNGKITKNWHQIDSEVNGFWNRNEIIALSSEFIHKTPTEIININRQGNSSVFKLLFSNDNSIKLKIYPQDNNNRMNNEYNITNSLKKIGVNNLPCVVSKNDKLNFAFYEWIDGDKILSPEKNDITQCVNFIKKINELKPHFLFSSEIIIQNASSACFSIKDVLNQIQNRKKHFSNSRNKIKILNTFLTNEYEPLMDLIISKLKEKINFEYALNEDQKILSPSDFGFHNAIKDKNDVIYFFDFEYFGWDDPVKLAADFYIHPAMNLSDNLREFWIQSYFSSVAKEHLERFKYQKFLYWMVWPLIILNDFREEVWLRRYLSLNQDDVNKNEILTQQLIKAKILLSKIMNTFNKEFSNNGIR